MIDEASLTQTTMLTAYHLRVQARATAPLELRRYTGASLRGALCEALLHNFCAMPHEQTCAGCSLVQSCPVSALVAPLRDEAPRGRDVVRPFTVQPPITHAEQFGPNEGFSFGLTLFGCRLELFPYVVMGLQVMGQRGIGRRVAENNHLRGQFCIERIQAVNPLTGEVQPVQQADSSQVQVPAVPITWADAEQRAAGLPADRLTLRLLTPLRLTYKDQRTGKKHIAKQPDLPVLVARLIERHDSLCREYGGQGFSRTSYLALKAAAEQVELMDQQITWVDLMSHSARLGRRTPIGGLVGTATYRGDLRPLLPLLVWGTVLQVGKDTTKGNGMYELVL
jgi:hypothetical protein